MKRYHLLSVLRNKSSISRHFFLTTQSRLYGSIQKSFFRQNSKVNQINLSNSNMLRRPTPLIIHKVHEEINWRESLYVVLFHLYITSLNGTFYQCPIFTPLKPPPFSAFFDFFPKNTPLSRLFSKEIFSPPFLWRKSEFWGYFTEFQGVSRTFSQKHREIAVLATQKSSGLQKTESIHCQSPVMVKKQSLP